MHCEIQTRKVNKVVNAAGNVLYVEKDSRSGRVLSRLLEDSGFEVLISYQPVHALDLCVSRDFGVALLEYKLPQMTGPQLAEMIKRLRPETPVVMISGCTCLPASELTHVDAHFGSNTSLDDLLQRMRTLCNRNAGTVSRSGAGISVERFNVRLQI
jgi:DNA-binding response OmpR family regulator